MSTASEPTIILSDLHLGHRASQIRDPEELAPILKEAGAVVFNGDTVEMRTGVDRPVGRRMAAAVARLCHSIGCRATFINGNHAPTISKIDHLDLMNGRMLVTHGDILFLGVAPWSRQALAYRKIHLRALAHLGPDSLVNLEKRLLATKRASLRLQLLEQPDFKPDLIILDLNIPKISGHTVLALYPPKKHQRPVVVFSASDNEADVSRAFSLGAQDFVHKPMDLDDYKTAVSGMVQKWAAPKEGDPATS